MFINLFTDNLQNAGYWILAIYVLNFFIAIAILYLERWDSSATWAWLTVLFLLPVVGIVLYMFLSQNIARQKIYRLTDKESASLSHGLARQKEELDRGIFAFREDISDSWLDLVKLNQAYGQAYYTGDNTVEVITDGHEMLARLLTDIEGAKESIHILYFIVKNDQVGQTLIEALTRKAREGVRVRFCVDALGSRMITPHVIAEFEEAGGDFARFFPPKFRFLSFRINYRNHRKLVAIDDRIGYIGGYNIAREYLGQKKKFGYWRDAQLRIEGGAVQDINSRFLMDWRQASETRDRTDITKVFRQDLSFTGNSGIQIVSSGPNSPKQEVKRAMMKMITSAKKSIYIQTPYFVPDESILEVMKMAAQSGVEVNIMIPCMPDHIFVYWATYSYVGEIIRDGGHVFIYDNGFLHAKTLVVDGEVYTVGSTNFDRRSFRLNFEANAFVYDPEVAEELIRRFTDDLKQSHELTPAMYEARSRWIKIKEPICRLLSDIL